MAKLSEFKPQTKNANKHTQRGRGLLQNSIQRDGYTAPMIAAQDGELFIGSHRLEVSSEVFGPDIEPIIIESDGTRPVIVKRTDIKTADDPKAVRLGLADNRIAQLSLDWDVPTLQGFELPDLDLVGFNERELIDLKVIEPQSKDAEPQVSRADELQEIWQVQTGDLWQIGDHRLICGDCTDPAVVERVMGGEKADLTFTDPPYGVERDEGFEGFEGFGGFGTPIARRQYSDDWDSERPAKEQFYFMLNSSKNSIFWGGNYYADILPQSTHWIVWDKNNTMPTFGDCELAWTSLSRKSVKKYEITYNGLIGKEKERYHPTQKPLDLFIACLGDYSKPNEIIIDFYHGSGTTLVACQNLGRRGRGIEISPAYCAVTLQRMQDAFPELEIKRIE